MARAKKGDKVKVHFTGRFEDGSVFDTSEDQDPLEFQAGGDQIIRGLSLAVVGMEEGDKRTISVPPEEGYGQHRPELQKEVPREALPENAKIGDPLQAKAGDQVVHVWVRELSEQKAVVDGNHPLAGKTLEFDLELVSVQQSE